MKVNKIQNNNYPPQFRGMIKFQNFAKDGKITKIETSQDLDKGLAQLALNNVFGGDWANAGEKTIQRNKLTQYIDIIQQTLGIKIPKSRNKITKVELKNFDKGYSIKSDNEYQLTHIREDQFIWD